MNTPNTAPTLALLFAALALTACPDDSGSRPTPDTSDTTDTSPADTADTADPEDTGDTGDIPIIPDACEVSGDDACAPPDTSDTGDTSDTTDARDVPDIEPGVWPWPSETITIPSSPDWRATLSYPDEPFAVSPPIWERPVPRWVKFLVFVGDPTKVYFQDGESLPTHLAFAKTLPPLADLSQAELDRVTLDNSSNKKAILGAVLLPPMPWGLTGPLPVREVGVQLIGHEPYPFHVARVVLELVQDAITVSDGGARPRVFYMPTPQQVEAAHADADLFSALGLDLDSSHRWDQLHTCHVTGWALGRLVALRADELTDALTDGRLGPEDVLLLDRVPASLPPVAGLITTGPSSATSQAAALATSFEAPFVLMPAPHERERAYALNGHLVALRAESLWDGRCRVSLVDLEAHLSPSEREELLELKTRRPTVLATQLTGLSVTDTAAVTRADRVRYGGLAANLGLLARTLPGQAPTHSSAVSFDLFERLVGPHRATIAQRLAAFSWPVEDLAALDDALAEVRALVLGAGFGSGDLEAVLSALATASFPDDRPLRVRPSTNFTALDDFAGAGLHAETLACLGDSTSSASSACGLDAPAPLASAVRQALAELWSLPSVLWRLRHGLDDDALAFALVITPARPASVLAHGRITAFDSGTSSRFHDFAVHPGLLPVEHPAGEPERSRANIFSFGTYMDLVAPGSALEHGAWAMGWESDYTAASALIEQLQTPWRDQLSERPQQVVATVDFALVSTSPPTFVLDHLAADPRPSREPSITPFLMPGDALSLCTFQGEAGAILGNHRIKARVTLAHDHGWLDDSMFASTFYSNLSITRANPSDSVSGDPATFPSHFHEAPRLDQWGQASPVVDGWVVGTGPSRITWRLETSLAVSVAPASGPLLALADHYISLTAEYATARPEPGQWPDGTTTIDHTPLVPCPEDEVITANHIPIHRTGTSGGISLDVRFWWPPAPTGITAGYTAPLVKWESTTITGLTTNPITLSGYWSQTYRPGHHNFSEDFVFEPRLEEGLDPALIAELEAKDIAALLVTFGWEDPTIDAIGLDGKIRRLGGGVDR